ncbi:MAG: ATP-binding protein [Gammaproteobacteria bacterium]|nr:ATP-binding protein [Gammaproteobacteria bacterium]
MARRFFKLTRSLSRSHLASRVVNLFLVWILLGYGATVVSLWWFTHYIIEQGLSRQATQFLPRFDELAVQFYFGDVETAIHHVREEADRFAGIGFVRYLDANGQRIIGEYHKSNIAPPVGSLDVGLRARAEANPPQPLHIERTLGMVRYISAIAPIRTHTMQQDDLLDFEDTSKSNETTHTIGWMEIGMDLQPALTMVRRAISYIAILLLVFAALAVYIGRRNMRNALQPLVELEAPLGLVARGDFDVTVTTSSIDSEIIAISDAINAAISGVRLRDLEKEEAVRGRISAEAANQAKSIFLASVSHEIRTPLNGILGFLSLMNKTPLDATQREYLKTINISARTLLSVINDVLDFSKMEAGKLNLEEIEFDLCAAVENAVTLHAANADSKGIDIILTCPPTPPISLRGDPGRITQVVSNLVGNAVKFTDQGSVTVRLEALENAGKFDISVSVSDTGIGMPSEVIENLFQPFTQADNSTTRKHGGTGLGLAISKRLMEMMGGRISVESTPGNGTSFTLTMSLSPGNGVTVAEHARQSLAALRALVVTSNDFIGDSLLENLDAWGLSVERVNSAPAAFDALSRISAHRLMFNAVLVDQKLAEPDVAEFATHIRALGGKNIHLLLLANLSGGYTHEAMADLGYDNCIFKPIKSSDLFDELVNNFIQIDKKTTSKSPPNILHTQSNEKRVRVLVVDDNEINRQLASILVVDLGAEVETADNGQRALDAVSRTDFDLVLMDVHMPIMDGIEATKRIRALNTQFARVPIVALTANALGGDRERYLAAGMDDYLSKPIDETALRAAFQRWTGPRDTAAQTKPEENSKMSSAPRDTASTTTLPIIDPVAGVKAALGKPEIWQKAVGLLLADLAHQTDALRLAFAAQEMAEIQRLAHKLAGGSSYCGTLALNEAAKSVELILKGQKPGDVVSAFEELLAQSRRLLELAEHGKLPTAGQPPVF